ncbi:MAG: LysM peptidoglycan-binding domain-containing protein [Acidimicrobiia bacterium]|jgi:LysM repeat protein|nr:LysM peptidoglycan-binding domain-containing protein [Acidimicrobiia bacterium]
MRVVKSVALAVAVIVPLSLAGCGGDSESVDTLPLLTAAPTVPETTVSPTTLAPVAEEFYTIQQGDTLFGIAQSFGVSMSDLISYNAIADPDAIQAGQRLKIPPTAMTTTAAPAVESTIATP